MNTHSRIVSGIPVQPTRLAARVAGDQDTVFP